MNKATRIIDLPERKVEAELREVSKAAHIRELIGLGHPRPQAKEPAWAAERLLRIDNIVKHYTITDQLRADIVEFEPGLARLALARWGSRTRFHRIYRALDELQRSFESAALPDIGTISERIGTQKCIEISNSSEGAKFREWFWQAAADAVTETGALEGEVAQRLKALSGNDRPVPQEFLVEITDTGTRTEGLAARPGAHAALDRQKIFSAQRLVELFARKKINIPASHAICPCGSEVEFHNCCGRVLIPTKIG